MVTSGLSAATKTTRVQLMSEADETISAPASSMIADPDGNIILLISVYDMQ